MYSMERKSMQHKAIEFYSYKTESFLNIIEEDITRLKQGVNFLILQKDIVNFAANFKNISTYQKFETYQAINDLISALHFSSASISEIILGFKESNAVFTIGSTETEARTLLKEINENPEINSNNAIYHIGDKLAVMNFYTNNGFYSKKGSAYTIVMILNKERLISQLNQYSDPKARFFITDLSGSLLAGPEDNEIMGRIISEIDASLTGEMQYITFNNRTYRLFDKSSDFLKIKLWIMLDDKQLGIGDSEAEKYLLSFVFISVLISVIYFVFSQKLIKKPLRKLVFAFSEIERGNLGIRLKRKQKDDMAFVYQQFNAMASKTQNLIEKEYHQQILTQKLTLKYLQNLINPHFLYNCFFTMVNMLETGNLEELKLFMSYMGQYFKLMHRSGEGITKLAIEAEHAQIYAKIQFARFSNRVQINIEQLKPGLSDVSVPSLTLQPLLENAFEHGFKGKKDNCILNVSFEELDNKVIIHVCDNGQGISDDIMKIINHQIENTDFLAPTDYAIVNIHRRLVLTYGTNCGLKLERSSMGGLEVNVVIDREISC